MTVTQDWIVPAWAVVVTVACVVLLSAVTAYSLARARSGTRRELVAARADGLALRAQVEELERRMPAAPATTTPVATEHEYVITRLGEEPPPQPAPTVAAPLFADLVLRESVVQAASLAAGVRRALAPEMRNKMRFEMRREVKRARTQRRADAKQARREWEAHRRAELADEIRERHESPEGPEGNAA